MVSNFRSDGSGLNFTVVFFSWNKKSFAVFINEDQGLSKLFGPYSSCATIIPLIREKRIFWITFEPFNSFSFYNFVISKPSNLLIF